MCVYNTILILINRSSHVEEYLLYRTHILIHKYLLFIHRMSLMNVTSNQCRDRYNNHVLVCIDIFHLQRPRHAIGRARLYIGSLRSVSVSWNYSNYYASCTYEAFPRSNPDRFLVLVSCSIWRILNVAGTHCPNAADCSGTDVVINTVTEIKPRGCSSRLSGYLIYWSTQYR